MDEQQPLTPSPYALTVRWDEQEWKVNVAVNLSAEQVGDIIGAVMQAASEVPDVAENPMVLLTAMQKGMMGQ